MPETAVVDGAGASSASAAETLFQGIACQLVSTTVMTVNKPEITATRTASDVLLGFGSSTIGRSSGIGAAKVTH